MRTAWTDGIGRLMAAVAAMALFGCGGGGDGMTWLFPLWIETDIAVADIDGDGRADVLTLVRYDNSSDQTEGILTVYRQTAAGVFAAPETYRFGYYPWRMVVADVDGDGEPDIVVTDVGDFSTPGSTWLLLQDPGARGRFLAAQRLPQSAPGGSAGYDVIVADIDGDGVPDIVGSASTGGAGASAMLQDRVHRGTFLPWQTVELPGPATALAAGDLDGDGRGDFAFWTFVSRADDYASIDTLAWRLRNADGTLAPAQTALRTRGLNVTRMSIVDVDGDGRADVLTHFHPFSTDYSGEIESVMQGPAGAMTSISTPLAGIDGDDDSVFADLDGDGRVDVALVGSSYDSHGNAHPRLNLFVQTGGGAFGFRAQIDLPITAPSRIAAGDVDGDGRVDLVILGREGQAWLVLQSHALPGTFEPARPLR